MTQTTADGAMTIWLANDVPALLIFAGRRWRVTDTHTASERSVGAAARRLDPLYGWRFQATEE